MIFGGLVLLKHGMVVYSRLIGKSAHCVFIAGLVATYFHDWFVARCVGWMLTPDLLLLWLGIDETPKVVLIALGAFFPVYLALLAGIRNVDRKLVEVGRLHRLSGVELTRRILLPAALPSLFTGLRGALSLSWMFLVAAELIAATQGLGYLLSDGRETSRPDLVIAAILLLAVLGKLSDGLLKRLETRALHWRDSFVGGEG